MLKPVENISRFKQEVIKAFESIARHNPSLYKFVYEATTSDSVFIIGGFLRSVVNKEKPRDLDLIFNMSNESLSNYIDKWKLPFSKNKFGGFKVDFKNIVIDIWTSEANWAFKTKVVDIGDDYILSKVAQGTFFNYDSLVFDLKTQRVNVAQYNECVKSERLDIIRKDDNYSQKNPGKIANVARAFRIRRKSGLHFSENLCRYIYDEFVELGIYDADRMVNYIYDFVSIKQTEKYRELTDKETIRSYVYYFLNTLKSQSIEDKKQLKLFS